MDSYCSTYFWKGSNDLALTKWQVAINIKQMSIGVHHSAFLTTDGRVFCCGKNSHGQVGAGSDSSYIEPVEIKFHKDIHVTCVAVGSLHTVCGASNGDVYCWGDTSKAQCGTQEFSHISYPICVKSFDFPVKKVACSCTASVCLLNNGKMYAWGTGSILQDTTILTQIICEPAPFIFMDSFFVLDVTCGDDFIVAIIRKSGSTSRKISVKNNYVVVHKAEAKTDDVTEDEFELTERASKATVSKSGSVCPLGLEVNEEHVFLPSSGSSSPMGTLRSRSTKSLSRSSLLSAFKLNTLSRTSSSDSVATSQALDISVSEQIKEEPSSLESQLQKLNVDTNSAEIWLKERIGSHIVINDNTDDIPAMCDVTADSTPLIPKSSTHTTVKSYVESMWTSVTSTSQAVSTAVQEHIVSKIPLLDKLSAPTSISDDSLDSESFGLMPVRYSQSPVVNNPSKLDRQRSFCNGHLSESKKASQAVQPEFKSDASTHTEVWSWGKGGSGQLGHGDVLDRMSPCCITALNNKQVYKVVAGPRHCLALTTDGEVYAWGDNSDKQIIAADSKTILYPKVLLVTTKIPTVNISAGTQHSLLLMLSSQAANYNVFLLGSTNHSELGSRLDFLKKLGAVHTLGAGPNGMSCASLITQPSRTYSLIRDFHASELIFYRLLKEIIQQLVDPLLDADFMSSVLSSSFGDCIRSMFDSLFSLIDTIGSHVQELNDVQTDADFSKCSLIGNCKTYLAGFAEYATHFHNFLAINGVSYLAEKSGSLLTAREVFLTSILERCQLEYPEDLLVKISLLLQLPLRRVSEYHECLEGIQLTLEDGVVLDYTLTCLENAKLHLSSQYEAAESTRIFWEKCTKSIASALKEPSRRVVRESKSLPLTLIGASKLTSNWFVLFNDVFVHITGSVHKVYPLEKLWIEAVATDNDSSKHQLYFITPEASFHLSANNDAEKAEWMWVCNQCIISWLASFKAEMDLTVKPRSKNPSLAKAPLSRFATHMFYKTGTLQNAVYKGQWKKAVMHGKGSLTWPCGKVYEGQFTDGEVTGYGKMTSKVDVCKEMKGYWLKAKLHGYGKTKYVNGDTYSGYFKDNLYHGHGVLKQKLTGSIYVGEWKEGKRSGYGVSDCKGEKYLGQWLNNTQNGPGVLVTLDGYYLEGNFVNNKLVGQGLMLTSDNTTYDGQFTGVSEVNGKGRIIMANGDTITGTFDGNWMDGIKVTGTFQKQNNTSSSHTLWSLDRPSNPPVQIGSLSAPHSTKWQELFKHSRVTLGCHDSEPDCEKAWEKVAILFANLKATKASVKRAQYTEQLEKIPAHNLSHLTLDHYRDLRKYIAKASNSNFHPLGMLMKQLVYVYRSSYAGTGTHPRLLLHAKDELLAITMKYYTICRILFPELPAENSPRKVVNAKPVTPSSSDQESPNESETERNLFNEESEIISPTLLIFPLIIPKIYEPLFHLYALQNEASDEQYWSRIQRFNKKNDSTLLSYLGVDRKFWFLSTNSRDSTELIVLKDKCYSDAIETLQRVSTSLTPAEKLFTIRLTFDRINSMVKENLPSDFIWSMDDLFPVFLFVVIRARLRYLGSEIHFIEDLMDSHLEHGELGLMFTTLRACHMQIQTERIL